MPPCVCLCVCVLCVRIKEREKREQMRQQTNVCVGGLLKLEHTAIEALHCEYKSTVKGHTSSLNEITIFQNKKSSRRAGNGVPLRHAEGLWMGLAAPLYKATLSQGETFMRWPIHLMKFQ